MRRLKLAISSAPFSPSPPLSDGAPSEPAPLAVGDDGREPDRAEASWRMSGRRRGDDLMFL
jgi:hypothetical protein